MPEASGVLPENHQIDPSGVFGTSFCSFRVNRKRSVVKKWTKNVETDHVLKHLVVVSELTGRDPRSKSDPKLLWNTLFVVSQLT